MDGKQVMLRRWSGRIRTADEADYIAYVKRTGGVDYAKTPGNLGFQIVMAAFCVVVLRVLGARSWWVIIVFAVAASIGVHAVFSDLLKVPLPGGVLEP